MVTVCRGGLGWNDVQTGDHLCRSHLCLPHVAPLQWCRLSAVSKLGLRRRAAEHDHCAAEQRGMWGLPRSGRPEVPGGDKTIHVSRDLGHMGPGASVHASGTPPLEVIMRHRLSQY